MNAPVQRRPPQEVMRLERLGALHQCRLSFMRQLTRRMAREGWSFSRPRFEIDRNGVGYAVYSAHGPERTYSLVAFAHDLPDSLRSDRVIAEAWDTTFALFDGAPTEDDISRLRANVPLQEAGRITERELTLSRANRSTRLWSHVVERLAAGLQPDPAQLAETGYLMRTTAVYGSGKFGAADREYLADRRELQPPFQAEMLTVYLIRTFVRDLVEHMAQQVGGDDAVCLSSANARLLGIGNSTGLGMAPFLVNHPVLFNNWIMAREEALARVLSETSATPEAIGIFEACLNGADETVARWNSAHPRQAERCAELRNDLAALRHYLAEASLTQPTPWKALAAWASETLSIEGQELLNSLMLEPYPDLVDGLADCMSDVTEQGFRINGRMTVGEVLRLLQESFGWALERDWSESPQIARAWYVSEEKLEPRLGERFEEPIEPYEQPLAPARDAALAHQVLEHWDAGTEIAEFLVKHPEHRHTVRRAQICAFAPYGEIRDNTIAADMMPIDMLRAKLSFFGATCFDPRSDRWLRICMYAGAPYPDELCDWNCDRWVYPCPIQ
ncbi:hypothetical protein [Pontivivens insulae]|uniref:Uncharacterized protein n=1 Tax=Pontivivens insulae TaxID=1639689 RepID=A0A2R8AE68_9RHOB|nr:hypothetical protein [Pontivivens insulae]RED11767.1 hypothetical protein DFR53_2477 [Pontivivens insulae]SPF30524.1 hypothetical protein POI8812_02863 [Pontivivens insulae]